jgi:hypothetical protein
MSRTIGRMMSTCGRLALAVTSTSAKCSTRCPEVMSTRAVLAVAASEAARSVCGTRVATSTRSGK